jgi:Cft2 family RNA processing exonuclease
MRFTSLTREIGIAANSYLLETGRHRLVLDAGMHPRESGFRAAPDYDRLGAEALDAIVFTHAHQDHVGTLPLLQRRFPDAKVFTSETTKRLASIMLHNSVNVMTRQREEGGPPELPLFTHREVDQQTRRWITPPLRQPFAFDGERARRREPETIELYDAGHILGAVGVMVRSGDRRLFYTGDVNFEDQTICHAARFPEEPVDVLVMEGTRGDAPQRPDYTRASEVERLAEAIGESFARGGAVLIPVFALGKTQELLAMLHALRTRGRLPQVPIYIGGLSTKLTEAVDDLAAVTPRKEPQLQLLAHVAPFVISGSEADAAPIRTRRIYALSSGMMTEQTLSNVFARRMVEREENSIFFVGYADPASPAGVLLATPRGEEVRLGEKAPPQVVRARVEAFQFSGHADRETLRSFARRVAPRKILLVHGDPAALEWFRATLAADLPGTEVVIPEPGVPIDL